MEYTTIPGISQKVSRLGLGTWVMGGKDWGGSDEKDAIRTIHAALDAGVNLIDTAPIYGLGRSEEIVAKALAGRRREDVVIATKFGLEWEGAGVVTNSTPQRLAKEIEDSLRRLKVDSIDLYQVHWPDPVEPVERTAEALLRLKEQGKIRAIGVSNYSARQMEDFSKVAPLSSNQPPYNLFERAIEKEVLPYTRKHKISTLAYSAICRGLLSGRMRPGTRFEGDDVRKVDPKYHQPRYAQYLKAVERLEQYSREHYGKRVIDLALRWVLDQPGVTVALWGARRPEQLRPLGSVDGWKLDSHAMQAIDKILRETVTDPVGPEFLAPGVRKLA